MKKILKVLGITFCTMLAFVLFQRPLKAEAAKTFNATWNAGAWYFTDDGGANWYQSKSIIENNFQDGDILTINGTGLSTEMVKLEIDARIGELAVYGGAVASVKAKSADTAYAVCDGSVLIVICNVKKLIANHGSTCQVDGNVSEVEAIYKTGDPIVLGITGTVGKANVYIAPDSWSQVTVYNVAAGKFSIDDDNFFKVDKQYYSLTSKGGNKELDKVPKTGSRFEMSALFFLMAAGLAVAGLALNRKKRNINL